MKKALLIFVFLLSLSQLFAQYQSDTIVYRKGSVGLYRQNGKYLSQKEFTNVIQTNPEAFKELQQAKSNYAFGYIFGYTGGFLIGYPIGTSLGGGKANWALAGIGAGLVCLAIPLSSGYNKHMANSVRIYNHSKMTGMNKVDFKLNLTANSIGVKMNF